MDAIQQKSYGNENRIQLGGGPVRKRIFEMKRGFYFNTNLFIEM